MSLGTTMLMKTGYLFFRDHDVDENKATSPPQSGLRRCRKPRLTSLESGQRKVVTELCRRLAIPFVERDLQVHDSMTADEVLVSTTPYCLAPVVKFNGVTVGEGKVGGPVFERLLAAWSEEVGLDIRTQFLGYSAARALT